SATFFTAKIKRLRKELRKAFNKSKTDLCRFSSKKASSKILQQQRSDFQQMCSSVETVSSTSEVVKSLATDPHWIIASLKLPSGHYTHNPESTLQHLLEYHLPGSSVKKILDRLLVIIRRTQKSRSNHKIE